MAGAVRPAVLLIALASLLFLLDAYFDGLYPGGPHWSIDAYSGLGWTSYLFFFVNAVMAVLIARGSERMLALRIGLAAFFMFERPVSAIALGEKPLASLVVHVLTALIEAVILYSTLRVWRLGHSVRQADLSLLSLTSPAPLPVGAGAGAAEEAPMSSAAVVMPAPSRRRGLRVPRFGRGASPTIVAEPSPRRGLRVPRFGRRAAAAPMEAVVAAPELVAAPLAEAPKTREPMAIRVRTISPGMSWTLGVLTLILAGTLVADGVVGGVVPGVTVDIASPAWLVYLFALVALVVAARAVHGGRFALRLLLALALIYFVERAFSPLALRIADPVSLGLHLLGAFVALALALATAGALRAAARSGAKAAA
jgi:hypothetical protein